MAEEQIVNGINLGELKDVVQMVNEHPELASFRFRAKNRWAGGVHCATTIQDFHGAGREDSSRPMPFVLESDEPAVLLGTDYGPGAGEALLHALASCLNATFVLNAAARGIHIDELELEMEGSLDIRGFLALSEEIRNGYEQIRILFKVKSDASDEQIQELAQLAQKRSPVFDIVTHETPVLVTAQKVESMSAEPATAYM